MKRNKDSLRDFWDNIKHINICIIGVPKEKREKGAKNLRTQQPKPSLTQEGKQISKYSKYSESQTGLTQTGTHQDTS